MTIKEYFDSQRWTFAKTYAAFAPHEYILRKRVADKKAFDKAVHYIQQYGMRMFYYKSERRYLLVDGWFYWALWSKDDLSDAIINRCRPEDYDIVFVRKRSWLKSKKAQEEFVQLELDLEQMESEPDA